MPSNPKIFINRVPYEVCTSVQRGLPFVATRYMKVLLEGILAAAQSLYPVTVCGYVVMGNHLHFLLIVQDPEDLARFMGYFKTEVAHVLNRLLGRTGESFWEDGYDSVMILSPEKFLERMEYIYLNPAAAGLVRSIEEYPGLSTYGALRTEKQVKSCKKVSRDAVEELPEGYLSKRTREALAERFLEGPGLEYELKVEPWAWLDCYTSSRAWDVDETREAFEARLKDRERELAKERASVLGANALESQEIRKEYRSERDGKRMLCMSHCPEQRRTVIQYLKVQIAEARESYRRRKRGEHGVLPPPGFFLPGGALLANLVLPIFLQL